MDNYFEVKCPKCDVTIIVDRITGKVLETREPLIADSTGDRFQDSMKKVKASPHEAEEKFAKSQEAERNKQKNLDDLFKKSLDQAKKEGPAKKPLRDIDFE